MGYCTSFAGEFKLDRQLESHHLDYLRQFSESRRMKRNEAAAEKEVDTLRTAVGLPVGTEGEFVVGSDESSVLDHNQPPGSQPSLWCCWTPDKAGEAIVWNGSDKPHNFDKWLTYIIETFLLPWGYKLAGEVGWLGEDKLDSGVLRIENNSIETTELMSKREEPAASRLIECLENISNKTQPSILRKKATEEIISEINSDSPYWLRLPVIHSLINSILEDGSTTVVNAAAESLKTLLDRGVEIPTFELKVFFMYNFSQKSPQVIELINRIKNPIIEKYGIQLADMPAKTYEPFIEPFALYWRKDSLEISDCLSTKMKLTREQTEKLERFVSHSLNGTENIDDLVLESEGCSLKFSGHSFFLQSESGMGVSSSLIIDKDFSDSSTEDLLKGLKRALELFDSSTECTEEILLNSPWAE